MKTTIGKIISKPNDYTKCVICGSYNWYENKSCHCCYKSKLKKLSYLDTHYLINLINDEEHNDNEDHYCDECEIDI